MLDKIASMAYGTTYSLHSCLWILNLFVTLDKFLILIFKVFLYVIHFERYYVFVSWYYFFLFFIIEKCIYLYQHSSSIWNNTLLMTDICYHNNINILLRVIENNKEADASISLLRVIWRNGAIWYGQILLRRIGSKE